jgi:hypothetical protein
MWNTHIFRSINSMKSEFYSELSSYRTENVAIFIKTVILNAGRAIAQAVSRRLPTSAVRVRVQVRSCGICGGQSGTGAGYLRVLRFPLPILITPTAPQSSSSSSIIRGWYNRPVSGRRTKWTQSNPHPKKLIYIYIYIYTECRADNFYFTKIRITKYRSY